MIVIICLQTNLKQWFQRSFAQNTVDKVLCRGNWILHDHKLGKLTRQRVEVCRLEEIRLGCNKAFKDFKDRRLQEELSLVWSESIKYCYTPFWHMPLSKLWYAWTEQQNINRSNRTVNVTIVSREKVKNSWVTPTVVTCIKYMLWSIMQWKKPACQGVCQQVLAESLLLV